MDSISAQLCSPGLAACSCNLRWSTWDFPASRRPSRAMTLPVSPGSQLHSSFRRQNVRTEHFKGTRNALQAESNPSLQMNTNWKPPARRAQAVWRSCQQERAALAAAPAAPAAAPAAAAQKLTQTQRSRTRGSQGKNRKRKNHSQSAMTRMERTACPTVSTAEKKTMKLDVEGTYECSVTGLIFEVTKAVTINYSLLSWSKYAGLVEPPWVVGGPLFDVRCELPSALTSIAFPHSLCLGDGGSPPAFKVLHIKGAGAAIEPSTDFSASHVRWLVSSLSPVGPLIRSEEPLLYHGAVILYKAVDDDPSLLFRVYVATNNDSFIKDISRAVKHSKKKFIKIDKPPVCQKLLQNGKRYRLICEPEAEITPEEIEFVDGSLLKLKSYIEVYFEKPDDFTLSLVELDSDAVVWKAKLRESDWIHYDQNKNKQTRIPGSVKRRKSTNSFSEEEKHCSKKQRSNNYTDGDKTRCLLTDQQLMVIAKLFGVEWKEIAIECLQMEMKDIQQIQANEEEVNIQKFLMLSKWREREQSNGTAQALCNRLREKVSYEIVQALEGFLAE